MIPRKNFVFLGACILDVLTRLVNYLQNYLNMTLNALLNHIKIASEKIQYSLDKLPFLALLFGNLSLTLSRPGGNHH